MGRKKICSICGKKYEGFGNNAQPINKGRCCDDCNRDIVIAMRVLTGSKWAAKNRNASDIVEMKSYNGLCFDYYKGECVLTDYRKIYINDITEENLSEAVNMLGTLYDMYVFRIGPYEGLLEDFEGFMKNPMKWAK